MSGDAKAAARRLSLPRQVCLPAAPAANRVPTCVNNTWPSPATCTTPPTALLRSPFPPPKVAEPVLVGASRQPQGGDGPSLPTPARSLRCQAAPYLLPGHPCCPPGRTPLFTQLIPGICCMGRTWGTGGCAAVGLGFGEGGEAGGESRGWERHRHQSAGSKQSWRRETTTSCQALLKTRRAQKGKGRKTKGLGRGERQEAAEGGTMEPESAGDDEL